MRVVGLDLSLRSTGVARVTLDPLTGDVLGSWSDAVGLELDKGAPLAEQIARVDYCRSAILDAVAPSSPFVHQPGVGVVFAETARTLPDLVVVEGALPGGVGGQEHERSWLRGLVYVDLYGLGVPIVEVAPSTLKVYATGDGRADKPDVIRAVRKHYGHRFTIPTRASEGAADVADAVTLAAMAARSKGCPIDEDHPRRLDAMKSPRWL